MIAVVALIVLGPKGLPAAARAIGRALTELRRATSDLRQSIELDPHLKDLPNALDELNRPLLAPGPYSRKRRPRDAPPEGYAPRPRPSPEGVSHGEPEPTPNTEPTVERTSTRRATTPKEEPPPPQRDESEGREG